MRVLSENYRGIEFVRLSSLPEEQKSQIWLALGREKIIKILRNNVLLNDCVQYNDYVGWYNQQHLASNGNSATPVLKEPKKAIIKIA